MGKSEIARLPVTRQTRLNLLIPEKQVIEEMTLEVSNNRKKSNEFPADVEVLNNQVAGHMDDGKALGKTFNATFVFLIIQLLNNEHYIHIFNFI